MPVDQISTALLAWYDANARRLPWRTPPGAATRPDPYQVWLSEIMLQQTNVTAVSPYFRRFIARWPNVAALAAAPDADVMAAWAGLGYYSRARNLLAAARRIAADGFPQSENGLRQLPGVGPYTAAAIAAIAFGEPCVAVDANVERVGARLFAIATPLPAARDEIRDRLRPLVPADRPGDFAQALMDLGSMLCTARRPDCASCPLAAMCGAHRLGRSADFPVRAAPKARPARHGHVWWVERDAAIALVRRPPTGLLGGMLGLPGGSWSAEPAAFAPPFPAHWRRGGENVRHIFTHFELTLEIYATRLANGGPTTAVPGIDMPIWTPRDALATCGLPTLFRKAVDSVLAQDAAPCFEEPC